MSAKRWVGRRYCIAPENLLNTQKKNRLKNSNKKGMGGALFFKRLFFNLKANLK